MKLSRQHFEIVVAILKEHLGGHIECTTCGSGALAVLKDILELRGYGGGGWALGGNKGVIPVVVLQCAECGQMHFYNAVKLGIVDRDTGGLVDLVDDE